MSKTISSETTSFIKRWNASKSNDLRQRILKNQLIGLILNRDQIRFLEEFANQISEVEKRTKILLLCRKLLVQNPRKIDQAHYQAFKEQYDFEMENDVAVDGIKWLDEELSFIKEVKEVDDVFEPFDRRKKASEASIPIETVLPNANGGLMIQKEILEHFKISKSTLDRWREDGFPCDKVGNKLYFNKEDALAWMKAKKPTKIQLSISK